MKSQTTSVPVCIAGAHRSGTSMLTRLLHASGLELGPKSDLMPPQADNPDGFWENLRFVAINDEVLNELGGAWDLPPTTEEDFCSAALEPLQRKAKLLIESFSPDALWGWKDPRNSLALPFWQSLLPELKVITIVRNPLEVAYSMRKRNGTSYAFGLRLWELYNRRLLAATQSERRLITSYDRFFESPEIELRRIAEFVGLPADAVHAAAALVKTDRRHTSFNLDQLVDARASSELIDLYLEMLSQSAPPASSERTRRETSSPSQIDLQTADFLPGTANRLRVSVPEREEVRQELAALRGTKLQNERLQSDLANVQELARREGRIHELQGQVAKRDQEIREATAKLASKDSELEVLRVRFQASESDFAAARSDLEKLREHLRRSDSEIAALRQKCRETETEMESLRDRFLQTNELLHRRSISLTAHEERLIELTARLRKQLHATRRLSRLLDDTQTAADRLRSSARWHFANPLGALQAAFSGRESPGYGHLDKIVRAYQKWLETHSEATHIDDALQDLARGLNPPAPRFSRPEPLDSSNPALPLKPIALPLHSEVDISIIIPVFNQFHFTHACLASIEEHAGETRFEVIVMDDASTDATTDEIPKIPGVVYHRNETNSGFIESCNRGAALARGEFLVFLNNDTQVTHGWLTSLRETFHFEPQAGLVGSKLIFPDGRLQEAGGIIWRDGSGWNRGKFDDPGKPEYNYLREVDYCSGASVMVPKSLFEKVGGFNVRFAPAYYEDVDLAFRLRRDGYKVLYQPLSEVIHFEGGTGGTDISAGAKQYQAVNRSTFVDVWADTLAERPANGDISSWEELPVGKQHILVIDHHLPLPDRDAGSVRMFSILDILHSLGHRVTFLPDNLANIPPYGTELQKRGIEVVYHPYLKGIRGYLEDCGSKFDTVILSRCDFAKKHIADVRLHAPQARIIFDTVDLHFLRQHREAALQGDQGLREIADERKGLEFALIDQADETWVVSTFEQELLREECPNKSIEIVSMIVETPGSVTPFALRRDFLFIGSFQHAPNVDAVLFFTTEIFPLVRPQLPGARFYVIGDKAPPSVIALAAEDVIVTGLQPNVKQFFDSVKLSVAPLRYGAGVKGKINHSMGLGVPVVATTLATEGMSFVPGEDILIADEPATFADALVALYQTEALWQRISDNGVSKTEALYSERAARRRLSDLFSSSHRSGPVRAFDKDERLSQSLAARTTAEAASPVA